MVNCGNLDIFVAKPITMETLVLQGKSKSDLKLIANLAKKIGVKANYISEEETEEMGMIGAIKKGRTGEYVDTDAFLKWLRK